MNKLMNRLVLAGMLCGVYLGSAHAATLNVEAEIKPDPSNPASAEIINNTPVTGFVWNTRANARAIVFEVIRLILLFSRLGLFRRMATCLFIFQRHGADLMSPMKVFLAKPQRSKSELPVQEPVIA